MHIAEATSAAIISSEISPVSHLAAILPASRRDLEENCQNLRCGDRTSARVSADGKLKDEPRRAGSSIVQEEREKENKRRGERRRRRRENSALCDIPRCEGGGVAEGVRSEKQEKVMGGATGGLRGRGRV